MTSQGDGVARRWHCAHIEVAAEIDESLGFPGAFPGNADAELSIGIQQVDMPRDWHRDFESSGVAADGSYTFDRLTPGTYEIYLAADEGYCSINRRVLLKAGDQLRIDLGRDLGSCKLTGQLSKPLRSLRVTVSPEFDWDYAEFHARTDATGQFEIEGLREGWYRVSLQEPEPTTAWISFRAPLTVHKFRVEVRGDTVERFKLPE